MSEPRPLPTVVSEWRVVELNGVSSNPGSELTLNVDPGTGRISGYGGINKFGGQIEDLGNGQLRFHRVFATRRAGPPEKMNVEAAYLRALNETRAYRLEETSLALMDGSGEVVVRMILRPWPPGS